MAFFNGIKTKFIQTALKKKEKKLMKKMNPVEFVQTTINSSNLSLNQWSKELSVSRQTIYNWLGNIHINVRKIYVNRIADISGKEIDWDKNTLLVSDKVNVVDKNKADNLYEKIQLPNINDLVKFGMIL